MQRKMMIGILIILATIFLMGQMCIYSSTQECDPECGEVMYVKKVYV